MAGNALLTIPGQAFQYFRQAHEISGGKHEKHFDAHLNGTGQASVGTPDNYRD